MIEVCHLVKRYGKFTAVDDLSFQIPDGCVFGFVGPNGAGKTTTMRIMAGLLRQDGGEILYDGREMTTDSRFLKETVGYMPDFFGVYDNLKVKEYMDFFAGTYAIPYRDRPALIGDLLELVDLTQKEDAYVDSLSRGMKQRLCLARSLIHDPKLLILDEPASGLDPRARVEMKEILKALGDMGKTILISSHILPELAEMCGRIGIIDHGTPYDKKTDFPAQGAGSNGTGGKSGVRVFPCDRFGGRGKRTALWPRWGSSSPGAAAAGYD